jgi:quercetin dioxygenase-like cupin family protein
VQRLASDKSDAAFRVYKVTFADGGRTNWHTHAGPQWLFVIDGRIRLQADGGAVQDLEAGDTAVVAPGERHWHGAVPGGTGTHIAVNLSVSGPTVWMERVSDRDYAAQ